MAAPGGVPTTAARTANENTPPLTPNGGAANSAEPRLRDGRCGAY